MIFYKQCPICGSTNLLGYAIDCLRDGPHMSRVKCGNCDIVFANPMADFKELDLFYTDYYYKGNFGLLNYVDLTLQLRQEIKELTYADLVKAAPHIYDYKKGGRFLDVGCGLGTGLLYVNRPEFELYATELDAEALSFVNKHIDNVRTFKGELINASYPDNFFDYVYCNHLIEHVLNPVAYMKEMYRILKKDGILCIGTPDRKSMLYRLYRTYKFATFSVPQIIDGIEHTFVFSKKNLAGMAIREGFEVELHRSLPLRASLRSIFGSKMRLHKKIARYIQTYFRVNQELICRK